MLPKKHRRFHISLSAIGLIMASLLLAGALALVTWRNLDREERLMEGFLRKEGLTLIRAFEAGARTTMMMGPQGDILETLVRETSQEETVAYIVIADENGHVAAAAGNLPTKIESLPVVDVLESTDPRTRLTDDEPGAGVFEIAKEFNPISSGSSGMSDYRQSWCAMGQRGDSGCRQAIFMGLYTREFEAARREDVKQSLIIGGVLLLLGTGGFYFLFLSQETRVTRSTLENMELYTRNVIDSMPAGLITIDTTGCIISSNRKALELFGQEGRAMEGRSLQDLTGEGECAIAPMLREGKEFLEMPLECIRYDGETIPVKVSASHLWDRSGELLGTVLILRDLREIRAMEEALERSRRHAALGRMAAGIAHEIRNPLGTLRGFSQFFARRHEDDESAAEYARLMVSEVDRLNRTVSALLQFARPREPEKQTLDVSEILERAGKFVREEAEAQGVELVIKNPKSLETLSADPDLLQQLLLNLLQNSLAATGSGGRITLGAARMDDFMQLWVRDNGRGMDTGERSKMFDPFFTTRKEGTGLGLAVVQQVVEQHGGHIEVESEIDSGTQVIVSLPRGGEPDEQI